MNLKYLAAATGIATGALLVAAVPASAMIPAGHPVPSNCGGANKTYDSYGTSSASTGVYKTPGHTRVGTLPRGNWFCYHSSSGTLIGQTYWVRGYGYSGAGNTGSTVSGWINDYYIAG